MPGRIGSAVDFGQQPVHGGRAHEISIQERVGCSVNPFERSPSGRRERFAVPVHDVADDDPSRVVS